MALHGHHAGGNGTDDHQQASIMTDPIIAFIDHMRAVNCGPADGVQIEADDKWHRFRIEGDNPKTLNGSYKLRIEPDGFAFGVVKSFREQVNHGWHIKSSRKASAEERAAWKAKADADRKRAAEEAAKSAAEAAERARGIWSKLAPGQTPYLDKKRLDAAKINVRARGDLCVVPMWSEGKLIGLQFIAPDGSKRFIRNAAKEGSYHAIKGDESMIVIGEGLATCAAIHDALGCMVVVAFDAGNLKPVAQAIRKRKPDARIVIAADGDQWTIPAHKRPDDWDDPAGDDPRWAQWREAGLTVNTGRDKALDAALGIGGAVVVHPPVPWDDAAKRTDFWDVWATDGADAVRAAFDRAINPPEIPPQEDTWEPDYPEIGPEYDDEGDDDILRQIRPLGRDGKMFYFFPRQCGQIMDYTATALAQFPNLVAMAPSGFWRMHFGGGDASDRKIAAAASVALIEECTRIGIYNPEVERGVGLWMDETGPVFNAGDKIYHSQGSCKPSDFRAKSVYIQGPKIGSLSSNALGNAEASELLSICLSLTWKNRQYGYALAGWIVAAIVAGSLRWKPHIVLTGEKGAGKSWVIENIIKPSLGDLYIERDGGTTEPKIRRDLGGNARPIIMDEAESENVRDRNNMEQIYTLARKASDGKAIGNADGLWYIRSCFCFSAINPRITQGADLDRITMLHLLRDRRSDAQVRFKSLKQRVADCIKPGFSDGLLARCFENMPAIRANAEVFSDAIEAIDGSKRFGDQIGTLMACAFSLTSGKEVTREFADEWCAKHDWRWAKEDNEQSDSEKLLEYILSSRIRYDDRGMMREGLVGSMIDAAKNKIGAEQEAAIHALGQSGIKVDGGRVLIGGPCRPMSTMLKDTEWTSSYKRTLLGLDGAEAVEKIKFAPTLRVRAVSIPLGVVLADFDAGDSAGNDSPFGDEGF